MKYYVCEDAPGEIVSVLRVNPKPPYFEWWNPVSQDWEYDTRPFRKLWSGDPDYRPAGDKTEVDRFIRDRRR